MRTGSDYIYNLYSRRRYGRMILFLSAVIIIMLSLWGSNYLIMKIAKDEREKINNWSSTIQQRAIIVRSTGNFLKQIQEEERQKVELYAEAQERVAKASLSEDISFYNSIIESNKTIPVVLTDAEGNIKASLNTVFTSTTIPAMKEFLEKEFSKYPPIKINYYKNEINYIYYKDSKLFTDIQEVLNDLENSFFSDIVHNATWVPVIIFDSSKMAVVASGNIDDKIIGNSGEVKNLIQKMTKENIPLCIDVTGEGKQWIFYENSKLLTQLRYYPYLQLIIISLFLVAAYMLFSISRKSEQNQVWAGLAKETAHQLGTPLSSIIAWVEILEDKEIDKNIADEIRKDIYRLNTITDRFSKIGSNPDLNIENIVPIIYQTTSYLKTRASSKISFQINNISENQDVLVKLNRQLFEWVIENIVKNAIDAIGGNVGTISLDVFDEPENVIIDISDTGKGLSRNMFRTIFQPGYTSKQRGWGLGLSLAKRIINEYHGGKIFVKSSVIGKGTTFRIILNK